MLQKTKRIRQMDHLKMNLGHPISLQLKLLKSESSRNRKHSCNWFTICAWLKLLSLWTPSLYRMSWSRMARSFSTSVKQAWAPTSWDSRSVSREQTTGFRATSLAGSSLTSQWPWPNGSCFSLKEQSGSSSRQTSSSVKVAELLAYTEEVPTLRRLKAKLSQACNICWLRRITRTSPSSYPQMERRSPSRNRSFHIGSKFAKRSPRLKRLKTVPRHQVKLSTASSPNLRRDLNQLFWTMWVKVVARVKQPKLIWTGWQEVFKLMIQILKSHSVI